MALSYDLDRKELKRDDLFIQKLKELSSFLKENRAAAIAVGVLVLLGSGAFVAYKAWQNSQEEKAAAAYYPIEKQIMDAMHQPPLKTDPAWQTKIEPSILELHKVIIQYRFTKVGYEGRVLEANLHWDHADYPTAADMFEQAVPFAQNRYEKVAALYSAALAYENEQKYDRAIPLLRQALASGVTQTKANVLLALARDLHAKGDDTEANRELAEVKTEFPNTAWAASTDELERSWPQKK